MASVPATGNPATTPVGRWYAGPFGGTRGDEAIPGDHRFLGATRDDTGLTLLGARYFDETTGAFISVDPLLDLNDPAQWNAYAYANSNPVTLSDASGLRPDETPAGMVWKGSQGFQAGHAATGLSGGGLGTGGSPNTTQPDFWASAGDFFAGAGDGLATFWHNNQPAIVGGIAGTVAGGSTTLGCLAATGGVGSVGCIILGGAVGGAVQGAVTNIWSTQVTRTQEFTWGQLATSWLIGNLWHVCSRERQRKRERSRSTEWRL